MKPKFKINQKVWYLINGKIKSDRITSVNVFTKGKHKGGYEDLLSSLTWCGRIVKETQYEVDSIEIKYGLGYNGLDRAVLPEIKVYGSKEELKSVVTNWANKL